MIEEDTKRQAPGPAEDASAEDASAEELGRIERPEAARYRGERKLYIVPLLFAGKDAPPEFAEKLELYWRQVGEQIAGQESRVGPVRRIYHESIALGGEEGLQAIERLNPPGHALAAEKCGAGAAVEPTELAELADECLDWERFMMMGFISPRVGQRVTEFYREASRKRFEHIASKIDETLREDEVAILFIREGHMVQFPQDIQVFMVAPPALDAIHRWLRERQRPAEEPPEGTAEGPADQSPPEA